MKNILWFVLFLLFIIVSMSRTKNRAKKDILTSQDNEKEKDKKEDGKVLDTPNLESIYNDEIRTKFEKNNTKKNLEKTKNELEKTKQIDGNEKNEEFNLRKAVIYSSILERPYK
jgi:hypothetical protein